MAEPIQHAKQTQDAKTCLRTQTIPALGAAAPGFPYFSLEAVRKDLEGRGLIVKPASLNRYLHELMVQGVIFDAGREWYTTVSEPFTLDREPVGALVNELEKRFPLLDFSCWSTAQIAGYGHHQLARFIQFVHTERDAMESVADYLREAGRVAFLDPEKRDVGRNVHLSHEAIVVRPAISRSPVEGKYATIEKILVDLLVEAEDLSLMDRAEHRRIVHNAAGAGRISMATLLSYASRRHIPEESLIGSESE